MRWNIKKTMRRRERPIEGLAGDISDKSILSMRWKKLHVVPTKEHPSFWIAVRPANIHIKVQSGQPMLSTPFKPGPAGSRSDVAKVDANFNFVSRKNVSI